MIFLTLVFVLPPEAESVGVKTMHIAHCFNCEAHKWEIVLKFSPCIFFIFFIYLLQEKKYAKDSCSYLISILVQCVWLVRSLTEILILSPRFHSQILNSFHQQCLLQFKNYKLHEKLEGAYTLYFNFNQQKCIRDDESFNFILLQCYSNR